MKQKLVENVLFLSLYIVMPKVVKLEMAVKFVVETVKTTNAKTL